MKIQILKSSLKSIKDHTLVIPVYQEGGKAVLPKNGGFLKPLLDKLKKDDVFKADFKQEIFLRYARPNQNIQFIGLGKKSEMKLNRLREALILASAHAGRLKVPSLTLHLSSVGSFEDYTVKEVTPSPNFTSSTKPSVPSANFLLMMEAVIKGIHS